MKANTLIDWVTFTYRCGGYEYNGMKHSSGHMDVQYVCNALLCIPMDRFQAAEYSRYGYRSCLTWNGIEILYDGNSMNMGVCVSMSGNACRVYELEHDMLDLFRRVHDDDDSYFTKVDCACDDMVGHINVARIIEAVRNKELRSRIAKKTGFFDLDGKEKDEASSVYIGSAKSELRFRIYDKAKEQGDYDGVWNRLEMVCRRDYAEAAVDNILNSGLELGECVAGMVAEKICFIVKDDVNISRCSVADWWADFLEVISRIKMTLKEKPKMSIESLRKYFSVELAACVWTCNEVYGESFWDMVIDEGRKKAGKRHRQIVADSAITAAKGGEGNNNGNFVHFTEL